VQCGTLTAPSTTVSGFDFAPVQMDSGNGFSCAVLTNGNLRCWGSNTYGQLGDGTVVSRSTANVNVE
jgi:alpha-tubulin suppressor-like RCC1 family protein